MEELLTKILNESHAPLEVEFLEHHFNVIQEQIQQMNENPNEFMNTKIDRLATVMGKISLSLRLLEVAKVNIKS
jgi:hypothetical protein